MTNREPVAWRWRTKMLGGIYDNKWEFRRERPKVSTAEYQVQPLYTGGRVAELERVLSNLVDAIDAEAREVLGRPPVPQERAET